MTNPRFIWNATVIRKGGCVIRLISKYNASICGQSGKAPGVISPPTPASNSIYRMWGRRCPRKLDVSAWGRAQSSNSEVTA